MNVLFSVFLSLSLSLNLFVSRIMAMFVGFWWKVFFYTLVAQSIKVTVLWNTLQKWSETFSAMEFIFSAA